jgi:diguanylate cyclase (GGDEF)-like protein
MLTARSWTVLIVDDEVTNRRLLVTLLPAVGYTTVCAAGGPEGLAAAAMAPPDLVLLDVMMPVMDGYEVAARLKADPITADVPIIMVSAHDDREARLAGLAAGAEEYITKPIDRAELYLRVRNLLRLKDLSDRLRAQGCALEQEVSERTADLQHLAHYDGLTGLPNRGLFNERLTKLIEFDAKAGGGSAVGVLFIDLDHFKNVNDTLGHGVGDELLCQVSDRLVECVRSRDTVARLGGDEFALILSLQDGPRDAATVASKISAALRRPFNIGGSEVLVSGSIGITLYPDDATNAGELVQYADTAMYRAKESGRDRSRFFTPQMNADLLARTELESALRRAVERDEFVLHYQPKVDLKTGIVSGVEALLRWARPGRGLVSPAEFIPVLESTGLILPVGRWVLMEATAQIARWLESPVGPMSVAVNVSSRQFVDGDLDVEVAEAVDRSKIPAELLELELTESTLMEHTERTSATLTKIRARGVRISIDDFGTGYSSLAYLRRFPIDTLKVDRAFVHEITTNADDAAIALTIIRLAHGLHLDVVAEGVETAAQVAFLREHRCDQMQGFFFSRPLPVSELEQLLGDGARLYGELGVLALSTPADHEPAGETAASVVDLLLADQAVVDVLESLHWSGASVHTIASALNRSGTLTKTGLRWTAKSVRHRLVEQPPPELSTPSVAPCRHDVHVYDHDVDLVARVSVYLASALHQRGSCVVIATSAHRAMFRSALVDLGLGGALHRPQFIEHDADDVLASFMRDGAPVAELFEQAVVPLVGVPAPGVPPVHAYGEMVDILWRAGNVAAALRLEDLWNDLQARLGFELLCAYAAEGLDAHHEAEEHGVASRHTELTGRRPRTLRTDPMPVPVEVA